MSEKFFGFKGAIIPPVVVNDLTENWEQDGISFSINDGIFEVNFSSEQEEGKAREIADLFIKAWGFNHGTKLSVDFNHSWKPKENGKNFHSVSLHETVKVYDRVIVHRVSSTARARIIGKGDSSSFFANQSLVEKCLKDEGLKKALEFYSEEVIDNEKPLYGIYKALEILSKSLRTNKINGRKALGKLANESEGYVDDVMQTTQRQRHAITQAKNLLSEQECKERAKILIDAYIRKN